MPSPPHTKPSSTKLVFVKHNPAYDYIEKIIPANAPIRWQYGNYERDAANLIKKES